MSRKSISRRDFLNKTTVGVASFGLVKNLSFAENSNRIQKKGDIIYREIGRTGIKVPVVNMGVMNADNPAVVRKAYESGIRFFDTAYVYQGGNNEKMLGDVIEELGIRDKVIIGTKIPLYVGNKRVHSTKDLEDIKLPAGKTIGEELKAGFFEKLETSLNRLKTDYVDILYFHNVSKPDILGMPIFYEIFNELKKKKKIRFCGVTTHKGEIDVLKKMAEVKYYDVALVGINFKYERRDKIKQAMKLAYDNGIGIVAMKTQGVDRRRGELETHHTAALKWVLQDDYISTAVPGFTTFAQLDENFSVAYDIKFTKEEKQYLKDYWDNRTGNVLQCEQCEQCLDTCPKNTDIPDLMRTYMYAAGYNNFIQSRQTFKEIPEEKNLKNCTDCKNCTAECPNGINIKSNIEQLKAIYSYS